MTATDQFLHFIGILTCLLGAARVLLPFLVSVYYETVHAHLSGRRYLQSVFVAAGQKIVPTQEKEAL
jgi:hypothetical protein